MSMDEEWDFNYTHRKVLNIHGNSASDLTDYQIKTVVHRGTFKPKLWQRIWGRIFGTTFEKDIHLNGHGLSWPNDIRFVGENGEELSYWVESFDAEKAIIWIKISFIPKKPGSCKVTVKFGKEDDVSESNGKNTFVYFEEFEKGA